MQLLGADYMRRVDPVLARLKGHLFLNSTRQLHKFRSKNKLRLYEKRAGAGLKTSQHRVNPLHIISPLGSETPDFYQKISYRSM